jgi:hypothetical protein
MSAFIVSKNHLDSIVTFAKVKLKELYFDGESLSLVGFYEGVENTNKLGQILLDANYDSVNYRYNEKEESYNYQFKHTELLTPIEIIKACHCLNYQSCEVPNWEKTKAYKIIQNIISQATTKISGYEEAEWGIY